MRANPIQLIGGFYADETRPWSQQDICNWLPVASESEGTRTPTMAKTPPGLSPFVDTGVTDPTRGVYNAEGRLFTVAGNDAFQISNTGVAIPLGTIPGVSRIRFAHNQITGGNQVLMVNGSAGYVWNTVTSTLTQITDPGYPGAIDAVFIDGYLVQIEPARRYAFHSDLADALSYNTLDRFTSEVSPDLLVGMAVSNNELLLLSETTGEFFENTGAAQQPFRSKRISFNKGCAGRYTIATMDNTVYWLGDDGMFYMLDGYTPRRISTRPIEQAIRGKNWAQAFAFTWEMEGHSVCYWTFPDGLTFGYDAAQQKWHRRESYGFSRWRVNGMAFWQGRWIAGDFQAGKLWELDWLYPWEGDQKFVSEITSPVIHDNQSLVLMPRVEVVMDTGMPEVAVREFPEQPVGPSISGAAPDGLLGLLYDAYQYTVTPGSGAVIGVSVVSGAYPAGLSLSSDGELTGTPAGVGSFTVTLRVTDVNGLWDEVTDTIQIAAIQYATSAGTQLSTTQDPYDWNSTVNVGASVAQRLVESRNGKVFAFHASDNGASVSSDYGASWTPCTGLPSLTIVALVFADDTHIAVPTSGTDLYVSTDGIAFSTRSYASDSQLTNSAIAIGETVIVGRSNSSQSRISFDGGNVWANCNLVSAVQVWAFAASDDSIIACTNANLRRSVDGGTTWTNLGDPLGGGNLASVAYGNGIYLVVNSAGHCATSDDDGLTWDVATSLPENMGGIGQGNEMVFDGDLFIVAGSSHLYTTPNGAVWTQRTNMAATAIAFYRSGQ